MYGECCREDIALRRAFSISRGSIAVVSFKHRMCFVANMDHEPNFAPLWGLGTERLAAAPNAESTSNKWHDCAAVGMNVNPLSRTLGRWIVGG